MGRQDAFSEFLRLPPIVEANGESLAGVAGIRGGGVAQWRSLGRGDRSPWAAKRIAKRGDEGAYACKIAIQGDRRLVDTMQYDRLRHGANSAGRTWAGR